MEVLKILQKSYFNKVKMIYIDPPYNTGNDSFIYPDKFAENKDDYQQRVGDKDENGYLTKEGWFRKNSKENGQYHSNWLNMMYPRLFLAKTLLRPDGVIFVSIDDNEVHNLRLLMDEVFGEENFVVQIIWKKRSTPPNDQIIGTIHEYILVYSKNSDLKKLNLKERSVQQISRYKNPDDHPKGPWAPGDLMANVKGGRYVPSLYFPIKNPETGEEHYPSSQGNWRFNKEKIERLIKNSEIYFGDDGKGRPKLKRFLADVKSGITYSTLWTFVPLNQSGSAEMSDLLGNMNIFDNPKPSGLIKELSELGSSDGDIILDFFAGSGTLAHAVMQLNKQDGGNRRYICVQLPEKTTPNSEAHKAGYHSIADVAKERIRRAAQKIAADINTEIAAKNAEIEKLNGQFDIEGKAEQLATLTKEIEVLQSQDLGFKVFKLARSNFKQWQKLSITTPEELAAQLNLFVDPVTENATVENMAYELAFKAGKNINTLECKNGYYTVNQNELILLLESVSEEIITAVIAQNPQKVVALDRLFQEDDQLKTNTSLQMKDAHITFETI